MLKMIKSKLHSKNGMTIGELLVAVLVLLLATGLLVGGVSFAARNFEKSFSKSQANVLQSTLKEAINGELRYTTTIYVNDPMADPTAEGTANDFTGYFSPNFGKVIVREGNVFSSDEDGQIAAGENKLVSGKSYSHGITADVEVTLNRVKRSTKSYANYFNVTVSVSDSKGKTLSTETFSVIPISSIELTKTPTS